MICAFCGLEKIDRGVKYPEWTVIKDRKTFFFCSTGCLRSWVMRLK